MSIELLVHELREHALAQVVLLLIACVACIAAGRSQRRRGVWLAGVAVAMPVLALAVTMFELAEAYARALELLGLVESRSPLPPPDQRSHAISQQLNVAPLLVGKLAAVVLLIAAWVAARTWFPQPGQRGHRTLVLAAVALIAGALWAASTWAGEFVFSSPSCPTCASYGWGGADLSYVWLARARMGIVLAGISLGVGLCVFAWAQARRGISPSPRTWVALLALLGLGVAAKLWTADERRDTQDYFRREPAGRVGYPYQHGVVPDPFMGPALEHCSFDWPGGRVLEVISDPELQPDKELVSDVELLDVCMDDDGLAVILADSELPITRVRVLLQAARSEKRDRLGVASLRPEPCVRATVGAFVRVRSCVVEFRLGPAGVPLDRFATWGELAAAADAAAGELVIAP